MPRSPFIYSIPSSSGKTMATQWMQISNICPSMLRKTRNFLPTLSFSHRKKGYLHVKVGFESASFRRIIRIGFFTTPVKLFSYASEQTPTFHCFRVLSTRLNWLYLLFISNLKRVQGSLNINNTGNVGNVLKNRHRNSTIYFFIQFGMKLTIFLIFRVNMTHKNFKHWHF